MNTLNIGIFASGSGSNAENIVHYFQNHEKINVKLILSNSEKAGVLQRAEKLSVKSVVFNRQMFREGKVMEILREEKINFIILAGFLWLMPVEIVQAFPNKIVNIHPALLPKYGGKGMYGMNVHRAVVENNEKESGITIHFINEEYDKGDVIFQASCPVLSTDTADQVAEKIHDLEYDHFPKVVEKLLNELIR